MAAERKMGELRADDVVRSWIRKLLCWYDRSEYGTAIWAERMLKGVWISSRLIAYPPGDKWDWRRACGRPHKEKEAVQWIDCQKPGKSCIQVSANSRPAHTYIDTLTVTEKSSTRSRLLSNTFAGRNRSSIKDCLCRPHPSIQHRENCFTHLHIEWRAWL